MCPKLADEEHHGPTCIHRKCSECGVQSLDAFLSTNKHKEVQWKRWELVSTTCHTKKSTTVKKRSLVTKTGTIEDLVSELKKEAGPFAEHVFSKNWQHKQQTKLRANIPTGAVSSVFDFAENYTCTYQRGVQSAYYSHDSATVHPIVSYYRSPRCNNSVTESCIMISDDLRHDYHLVNTFQQVVCQHLTSCRQLKISAMHRFSVSAGQYKSRGAISEISYAQEDFTYPIQHNHVGTRHGKGACDGEGAVIKSQASIAVRAGTAIIKDAKSLYEYCQENLRKDVDSDQCCGKFLRSVFYVSHDQVDRERSSRCVKTVTGTRKLHCIKTVAPEVVATRNLTCVCNTCMQNDGVCQNCRYVEAWKVVSLQGNSESDMTKSLCKADVHDAHHAIPSQDNQALSDQAENHGRNDQTTQLGLTKLHGNIHVDAHHAGPAEMGSQVSGDGDQRQITGETPTVGASFHFGDHIEVQLPTQSRNTVKTYVAV
uniref:uncharacterized protein n=1 Tax=Myxine glutinosa TaxID=7769 RepID=UPI00358E6D50